MLRHNSYPTVFKRKQTFSFLFIIILMNELDWSLSNPPFNTSKWSQTFTCAEILLQYCVGCTVGTASC